MTRSLLQISASARDDGVSQSRRFGAQFVRDLMGGADDLRLVRCDLGRVTPPYPDAAFMTANLRRDTDRTAIDHDNLAYSEMLLREFDTADLVVIDTPMHNFTVPAVLKSWIDYIVRPGRSFVSTPQGKAPLLKDRPVRVIVACGGSITGPYPQQDFLGSYLRYVFATIGITDVDCLMLERLGRGEEAQAIAQRQADAWIAQQIATLGISRS
jgi:FMN-dependent NADH-azoreductase